MRQADSTGLYSPLSASSSSYSSLEAFEHTANLALSLKLHFWERLAISREHDAENPKWAYTF